MPKYRALVAVNMYREFTFEADDDDLAWDHIEHLTFDRGVSYVLNEWEESGPDEIHIIDILEA